MWVERAAPFFYIHFFSFHSLITIETIFVKTFIFILHQCVCDCVWVCVCTRGVCARACVRERGRGGGNTVLVCAAIIGTQQTYSLASPLFFFFFFSHSTLTSVLKVKVWANQRRRPRRYAGFGSVSPRSVFVPNKLFSAAEAFIVSQQVHSCCLLLPLPCFTFCFVPLAFSLCNLRECAFSFFPPPKNNLNSVTLLLLLLLLLPVCTTNAFYCFDTK